MKQLSKKKVKERRKVGIVKAYMSRAAAIRKLQIPLDDFRRLCILKGVYPVEPKNKSKITGGNTRRKTYFFTRDIQSMIDEPILHKFYEFKVFMKRLTRAKGRHDLEKFQQIIDNKPIYKLDSVVKERYPRFVDALRDCDDALSMCSLYAMFSQGKGRPDDLIKISRRLTVEFMHYVMHTRSLRKVFISIKGYYYQAEIMGQTITWMVPHQFVIDRVSNVDLNVLKTFTEFYVTLLGFINYKLFKTINAPYPPKIVNETNLKDRSGVLDSAINKKKLKRKRKFEEDDDDQDEDSRDDLIAALNKKIFVHGNKIVASAENENQQPDVFEEDNDDEKMTLNQILALEKLFSGLKFFLNREVPRESLTFVIRSFGGEVLWDDNQESDPTITHHIVDRDALPERNLNRNYIQPQWVYDSVNMRALLPVNDYIIGASLPPHLSPFVEKRAEAEKNPKKKIVKDNKSLSKSKMKVRQGKPLVEDKEEIEKKEEAEHRRMGIMMIPKKKKRLFDRIMKTQREKRRKVDKINTKREIVEAIKGRKQNKLC